MDAGRQKSEEYKTMENSKCRICRRQGAKLFLKGDKCMSPKCLVIKRPYAPGLKKKRNAKALSEFGKELREKQRLKNWYNLRERQFKSYVNEALEKRGHEDTGNLLIKVIEGRLDNVVFRSGFATSRSQARQIVNHGHFRVNGKKVDIPSAKLKKGDVVSISESAKKKSYFQNISPVLKKYKTPSWIELNAEKFEAKIIGEPNLAEAAPPAEVSAIFEFYSR